MVHLAEQVGIKFEHLTSPGKYIGTDTYSVKAMECIQMKLGEPDDSGRRRPIPIEGSNFVLECDLAIVAIGTGTNPVICNTITNSKGNKWGYIEVNHETNEIFIPNVYAGGEIVTGSATVTEAIGAVRIAANAMHEKLRKKRNNAKNAGKKKKLNARYFI